MGIFFDQDWFDARLKAAGLTRGSMAQAAGMTIDEVEMVFADRRELGAGEVHAIARALSADPREIASRSGLADLDDAAPSGPRFDRGGSQSGQQPGYAVTREVIAGIHERLDRLERMLEMVIQKLDRR
jgi:transcriptional regulator with XRE-family HTH domain